MGRARNKTRRTRKANAVVEQYVRPTEAREAHNDFRSAGMAVRVVPVIVRLHEAGVLNDREFEALAYYRDQASLAEHSPVRSCCDFSPRGGHGPGVAILSATLETGRMERDMGPLWPLCRAVAVDDITLERWCIDRHGAMAPGGVVADPFHVGIATLELKYAAGGIVVGRA
jgi:hypothetical protein